MDELREAWERDGYVVLRDAAPGDALAAYGPELAAARDGLLVRAPGDEHVSLATGAEGAAGAVDPYVLAPAARALLLPAPVVELLTARYDGDAPLLFDAIEAEAGPPSGDAQPYRDATYVALAAEPETLVTAIVALPEAGATVTVLPGSQQVETSPFSGRYRHFNPERDGDAALARHREELAAALGDGAASDTITLVPGDVVLWSADLVHGPVEGAALVAHLCPVRVAPSWFAYRPERARHAAAADGTAWVASQHYDLVDAVAVEAAPVAEPEDAELERVEAALREHDEDLATDPEPATPAREAGPSAPEAPGAPRSASAPGGRRGGLVDSVRGIMNRRSKGR